MQNFTAKKPKIDFTQQDDEDHKTVTVDMKNKSSK